MNPFLYKAHPLLYRVIDLVTHPASSTTGDVVFLIVFFLVVNLLWAACLLLATQQIAKFRLSFASAYKLALGSVVLSIPLMLTLVSDFLNDSFQLRDRYIFLFALIVVVHITALLHGVGIKHPHEGAIGLEKGFFISLFMMLLAIPVCILLRRIETFVPLY